MSRRIVPWCLAIGFVAVVGAEAAAAPPARPNILFIFTDDHAQHAISAYGSVVNQTPHLDRLAGSPLGRMSVTEAIVASQAD